MLTTVRVVVAYCVVTWLTGSEVNTGGKKTHITSSYLTVKMGSKPSVCFFAKRIPCDYVSGSMGYSTVCVNILNHNTDSVDAKDHVCYTNKLNRNIL